MKPQKEQFSFLNLTSNKSNCKINTTIHCFENKPFAINYSNLLTQYEKEIENYKNYPELMDIDEFSMNYSFGYHFCNNIDDAISKQAMFFEVKNYLKTIKAAA